VHVCAGSGGGGVHVDGTKILGIESALKARHQCFFWWFG
jgi:hypothetical protein